MISHRRTLEQERAAAAWGDVAGVRRQDWAKKYGALARGAPADIQVNGLGQTLAFWRAKREPHHLALFRHVSAWVTGQMELGANANLLEWVVITATTDEYRRATTETLAFLAWLKRFAEAELGDEVEP